MRRRFGMVVCVVAMFCLADAMYAAAAPPFPQAVEVVGPVEVTDQTVQKPVQGNFVVRLLVDERTSDIELVAPPEGMMAVIQYLTIRSFPRAAEANPSLQLMGAVGSESVQHFLGPLPEPVPFPVISSLAQISQFEVLLYSTEPVRLLIDRGNQTDAVSDFFVSFSGYLVEAPATP